MDDRERLERKLAESRLWTAVLLRWAAEDREAAARMRRQSQAAREEAARTRAVMRAMLASLNGDPTP